MFKQSPHRIVKLKGRYPLRNEGKLYSGRGLSTDITGASVMAYVNALNKIVFEEEEE